MRKSNVFYRIWNLFWYFYVLRVVSTSYFFLFIMNALDFQSIYNIWGKTEKTKNCQKHLKIFLWTHHFRKNTWIISKIDLLKYLVIRLYMHASYRVFYFVLKYSHCPTKINFKIFCKTIRVFMKIHFHQF